MKKRNFVIFAAVFCLIAGTSSAALAYGGYGGGFGGQAGGAGRAQTARGMGQGQNGGATITPQLQSKFDEAQKLRGEIFTELHKASPDKARARELHSKVMKLMKEIGDTRFQSVIIDRVKAGEKVFGPGAGMGRRPGRMNANADAEVVKLRGDMAAELAKDKPSVDALQKIHERIRAINTERANARFEEVLKDPSKYGTGIRRQNGGGGLGMFW